MALHDLACPTILDKLVGTFSFVFLKVLKNVYNQELLAKLCHFGKAIFPLHPTQINVVGQHIC